MKHQRAIYLLQQYAENKISEEERAELTQLINEDTDGTIIPLAIRQGMEKVTADPEFDPKRWQEVLAKVISVDKPSGKVVKMFSWKKIAVAASIIFTLGLGSYLVFFKTTEEPVIARTEIKNDVAPGKQGAILKLSNGKVIVLDTAQNGKLLDNFTKSNEGLTVESTNIEYATLTTPRARTQALTLSDGSKVWLNAESSIYFPTVFSGNERLVKITGEAYFEVAHNAAKPFKVSVNNMEVEVLGTHFNINAYNDENIIKTTLLEGSVKISDKILKPGQQAQLINNNIKIVDADIDEAVAWKNGMFSFKRANIQTIMRQVARWYDVEVVFEGKVPSERYNGETSRNLNASQMLKVLEESGIRFRIEGKKIVVTN